MASAIDDPAAGRCAGRMRRVGPRGGPGPTDQFDQGRASGAGAAQRRATVPRPALRRYPTHADPTSGPCDEPGRAAHSFRSRARRRSAALPRCGNRAVACDPEFRARPACPAGPVPIRAKTCITPNESDPDSAMLGALRLGRLRHATERRGRPRHCRRRQPDRTLPPATVGSEVEPRIAGSPAAWAWPVEGTRSPTAVQRRQGRRSCRRGLVRDRHRWHRQRPGYSARSPAEGRRQAVVPAACPSGGRRWRARPERSGAPRERSAPGPESPGGRPGRAHSSSSPSRQKRRG